MNPNAFTDSVLGYWSSHPRCVRRRSRHMALIALLPIAIFGLLLAYRITSPSGWLGLLQNYWNWLTTALLLATATLSALLTIGLTRRLSLTQWRGKSSLHAMRGDWVDGWLVLPCLGAAVLLPWLFRMFVGSHPISDWLVRFVVFLPAFALLAISASDSPHLKTETRRRRRYGLLMISLSFAFAAALTTLYDIAVLSGSTGLMAWSGWWIDWYGDQDVPLLGWLIFGLPAVFFFYLFRVWTKPALSDSVDGITAFSVRGLGATIREIFSKPPKETDESPPDSTPPSRLIEVLMDASPSEAQSSAFALAVESSLRTSGDQADQFQGISADIWADQYRDEATRVEPLDWMISFALARFLVGGAPILWIAPKSQDIQNRIGRIQSRLDILHLRSFVRIEAVDPQHQAHWPDRCHMPEILLLSSNLKVTDDQLTDWMGLRMNSPHRFETVVVESKTDETLHCISRLLTPGSGKSLPFFVSESPIKCDQVTWWTSDQTP